MVLRVACALLLLSACALRPRYLDLAKDVEPPDVVIQVVDRNNTPVAGARVEFGDRVRFKAVTDENGVFRLPVEKKYADENALVVVVLPKGVRGYRLISLSTTEDPPLVPADTSSPDAGVTTM